MLHLELAGVGRAREEAPCRPVGAGHGWRRIQYYGNCRKIKLLCEFLLINAYKTSRMLLYLILVLHPSGMCSFILHPTPENKLEGENILTKACKNMLVY